MKGFMDMMSQAKDLQAKMSKMQDELAELEIVGVAGAGLVRVTLDGKGNLKGLKIDESLIKPDDVEIMEDLILAAHTDARAKLEQASAEKMQSMAGDLPLPPGMKLF
ncbi:MAG: YbaB/EbfC family nucleoid-associated protein [Hyphomicrobiaceae bacterium]|nr:YbaB/EbfC family nucleoid-associated protein [Hyphomicrobiaceae bacterium]